MKTSKVLLKLRFAFGQAYLWLVNSILFLNYVVYAFTGSLPKSEAHLRMLFAKGPYRHLSRFVRELLTEIFLPLSAWGIYFGILLAPAFLFILSSSLPKEMDKQANSQRLSVSIYAFILFLLIAFQVVWQSLLGLTEYIHCWSCWLIG